VTISVQWAALPALAASLAVAQGLLLLLARGLGCRLSWKAAALANALALAAVAPWLVRDRLMVPLDETIQRNVPMAPGTPAVSDPDPHGLYNDVILQLLPWEMEVRRAFGSGRLPLWSDRLDGGSSPWVNPQAGVLSPVANLARWAPLEHALLVALALKILIACQGAWLLARRLGAGRTASALAAGSSGLGGAIFPWALFPLSSAAAFIPWVVLAGLLLARRPTRKRTACGAIVFACLLLSGHPETALAGTLLAAVCALSLKRRRTPWRRVIAGTSVAMFLGVGLAAPQILPFLWILPETQRAVRSLTPGPSPISHPPDPRERGELRQKIMQHEVLSQIPPLSRRGRGWEMGEGPGVRALLAPANPWAFGRPFRETYTGPINWPVTGAGYAGLVAFAGLLAPLAARRCRRRALPLLAFAGMSFLLAAGFRPFERAVHFVPFLGAVAFDRFLPVAALALGLAGALGIDELLRRRPARLAWGAPLVAAAASLAVRHDPRLVGLWLLILGGVLVGRRWRTAAGAVLAVALVADLLPWGWDFLPTGHRELFYPKTPFVAAATAAASFSEGGGGPWRATAEGFLFYPSLFPVYGTAELRPHNPVALAGQLALLDRVFAFQPEGRRYKSAFHNADHPLLSFLNVRVLVSRDNLPPHPGFERIDGGRFAPMRLYRNPDALPRLFLPAAARVRPRSEALDAVAGLDNPRRVILCAEEVGEWRPPERRPWDPAAVRVLEWRPGRIAVEVPAEGEKLLASSLPFPAGWEARAAGAPLRKLTVNTAYLGVAVPDGVRRVNLRFVPPGLRAGLLLGLAALIGTALLLRLPRAKKDPAR
jgi:hypothetical protein